MEGGEFGICYGCEGSRGQLEQVVLLLIGYWRDQGDQGNPMLNHKHFRRETLDDEKLLCRNCHDKTSHR